MGVVNGCCILFVEPVLLSNVENNSPQYFPHWIHTEYEPLFNSTMKIDISESLSCRHCPSGGTEGGAKDRPG